MMKGREMEEEKVKEGEEGGRDCRGAGEGGGDVKEEREEEMMKEREEQMVKEKERREEMVEDREEQMM